MPQNRDASGFASNVFVNAGGHGTFRQAATGTPSVIWGNSRAQRQASMVRRIVSKIAAIDATPEGPAVFDINIGEVALGLAVSVSRQVNRNVSVGLSLAATVSRVIDRKLSLALTLASSVSRVVSRAVAVPLTLTPTVSALKSYIRNISVALTLTPTVTRQVSRNVSLALPLAVSVSRVISRKVAVALSLPATVTRVVERRLNVALNLASSVIADFVPGSTIIPINVSVTLQLIPSITLGPVAAGRRLAKYLISRVGWYG